MKIAHIAPPWIAIPPENYGGTEIVIYNLVEEQVALGHDVTLFAPGDAKTSAKQVSFFPQSLISSGVPWAAHLKAYEKCLFHERCFLVSLFVFSPINETMIAYEPLE